MPEHSEERLNLNLSETVNISRHIVIGQESLNSPRREGRQHLIWDLLGGVLLSAFLATLVFFFSKSQFGDDFSWITYRLQQRQLSATDDLPVTVIDISNLRADAAGITPREPLKELLGELVREHPRVIGIDIDFSPERKPNGSIGFVLPNDTEFFSFCRNLSVPVYLGISRTQALPPDQWLGLPLYSSLAAALIVPRDDRSALRSLADQDIRNKGGMQAVQRAQTMSTALARRYRESEREPSTHWPLETFSTVRVGQGTELEQFRVDYSVLTRLWNQRVQFPSGALNSAIKDSRDKIRGKMVLLGDVLNASDTFANPISGRDPIPGVLVHAAAAYTAAMAPLRTIAEPWREMADFLLALFILNGVTILKSLYGDRIREHRLFVALTVGAVACVLSIGFLVNSTRIVWDDFLLVAIAVALHPLAHRIFAGLAHQLFSWLQPAAA